MRLAALRHLLPTLALIAVTLAMSGASLWRSGEAMLLDAWFRLRGPVPATGQVVLVLVDDESIRQLGGWPLTRQTLARLVERLDEAGAEVIAFDLLLTEPGRVERDHVAPPPGEAAAGSGQAIDRYGLQGDRDGRLIAAMAAHGRVVLPFAFVFDPAQANRAGLPVSYWPHAYSVVRIPGGWTGHLPLPVGVLGPADPLVEAAHALGHVTAIVDPDGHLRTDHTTIGFDGLYYPSLAVEVARLQLGLAREAVAVDLSGRLMLGDRAVPVDPELRLWPNERGDLLALETIPAHLILDPPGDAGADDWADRVEGRAVLVGAHALGLGDTYRTPFAEQVPGVAMVAMAADSILAGDAIQRPRWLEEANLAAMAVLGLLTALLWAAAGRRRAAVPVGRPSTGPALAALGSLALLVVWLGLAFACFALGAVWIDAIGPALAVLAQTAFGAAAILVGERRRRAAAEHRTGALQTRVSQLQQAAAAAAAAAKGKPVMVTVLFTDLVGYSAYAEKTPPQRVLALLQRFQSMVVAAVVEAGGVVDNYMGDGALAYFGIGDTTARPAIQAVRAARRLTDDWLAHVAGAGAEAATLPRIAAGIHSGHVVTGDVGTEHLTRFTLVGDAVNLASRMERACRDHKCRIVITAPVRDAAHAGGGEVADFAPLGELEVRGRDQPVVAWGLPIAAAGGQSA
ncbi:MAG: adenylate/guanylate cyclase domain-containing protein [Rhodospirillaceae bacterium]|nr:adenylate/guanylate cyclase domain-containing protein [Rhodospirillaceae bacterium]